MAMKSLDRSTATVMEERADATKKFDLMERTTEVFIEATNELLNGR